MGIKGIKTTNNTNYIAGCLDCDKEWEGTDDARKLAQRHALKHGHSTFCDKIVSSSFEKNVKITLA